MNKVFYLLTFIYFTFGSSYGQISFERGNTTYRNNVFHFSGVTTGFTDLNGDLYDDLVVLNKSKFLEVGYNQGNRQMKWMPPIPVNFLEEYSLVVGDYNNDGLAEITTGGNYSGSKTYGINSKGQYEWKQSSLELIYTQAANVIDFNNDGFLDYFACHDEGNNLMLQNDKKGNLNEVKLIDFSTIPTSDKSGNYGSEWCDIDNDGDQDLYIAKCKFGVNNKEDARRHNMLFINKGNGTFVNEAEVRGLKIKGQSWTGSFADIDNDGDMDCVVTNHDEPHGFYENDGKGFFKPLTNLFLPVSFAYQSLWADFDNDGFIDLLITGGDQSYLFRNNEGKNFVKIDGLLGQTKLNSAALGDINDDGFTDISAIYGIEILLPSAIKDELFINKKNNNHFLKFALVGTTSNKQGIGARLTLYGQWGKQSREVQSGVSYSISNSLNQIFGLGKNTKADSLIIRWPSGIIDKYYNISADEMYVIQEGRCMTKRFNIDASKDIICGNEGVKLSSAGGFQNYKWSHGVSEAIPTINNEGGYTLQATSSTGCTNYSTIKFISKPSITGNFILPNEDTIFFCKDITLNTTPSFTNIKWNNDVGTSSIKVTDNKTIFLSASDKCNQEVRDTSVLKKVDVKFIAIGDTVKKGGNALLKAKGENIKWYRDKNKVDFLFEGQELILNNIQKTTSVYAQNTVVAGKKKYSIGEKSILPFTSEYPLDTRDVGLYFNAYQQINIKSFDVTSDREGVRRFLVISYAGDTVARKDVFIGKTDRQTIEVDFTIPVGSFYQLKTDEKINMLNFGTIAPRLKGVSNTINFPYEVYGIAEIPTSFRAGTGYYYFFNIQLEDGGIECESELLEVKAILDTEVSNVEIEEDELNVYPNPITSILSIDLKENAIIEIYNEIGQKQYSAPHTNGINDINCTSFPAGLYFLKVKTNKNQIERKIIKVN
jgi:hypothetical protein